MRPIILIALSISLASADVQDHTIFPLLPVTATKTNNSLCNAHSELYTESLENFTLWASEMWDATAKSASGVLRGNIFQMGHFEQCLTAEAPFDTKYCLVNLKAEVPQPKEDRDPLSLYHNPGEHILQRLYPFKDPSQQVRNVIQVGWCIPASCSGQNLQNFLNIYLSTLDFALMRENVSYTVKVPEISCTTNKDNDSFNAADFGFCALALVLVLLVITGTILDVKTRDEKISCLSRYLITFSAKKNFNDLTKKDESNNALSVFYGMRTLCILCIIMAHRFGTFISAALMNFNYVEKEYRGLVGSFITHEDFFVDVFFIMSGLLVTYCVLNQLDKHEMNPGFIIMMRYIRLTPVYAFVIFYYATVFNYTGTGPLWKIVAGQDSLDCKKNWWTNLLYISNYVNADHMCMTHSWYLPCDFHYFIVATALCFLIKKHKKAGLCALIFMSIVSILIPFTLTIVYQRPAVLYFYPDFLTSPKTHPDFLLTYIKSHTRATVYFLGMSVGYFHYKAQQKIVHLSRARSYLFLLISVLILLSPYVGGAVFYNPYHKYNALESAFYAALSRPVFAAGIIGISYVCSFGYGGFIRDLLQWSPWIPLSKLVYGAYLVHMQFQLRAAASFKNPQNFSHFEVFSLSLSDMMWSFLTACVLYLLVEAPFRRIFKEIFVTKRWNVEKNHKEKSQNEKSNGCCDSKL